MAKIKLNGDTSGYIEISAPAVSGNNTLELGPGTKILTNLDNTFTGVSTFSSDIYLGNDIYLTDGSSGYERVEVDQNDIRVTGKHIHSQFGVWTRSTGVNNRRNGIDGDNNDLLLYANSAEKVRITSDGKVLIGSDTGSIHGNRLLQIGKTDRSETYFSIVTSTSGESGILFADTTTNDTGGYRGQIRYHHSDDSMNFRTGATERLRIDSSGHLLHGVTADEDTSGSGGLRFINSGDIQIDGDQKALVFRSTNNTAQLQSAIEWWNENGAGVQSKIACDRTAISQGASDLVFYTSANVDTSANSGEGDITERVRIASDGNISIGVPGANTSGGWKVKLVVPDNAAYQSALNVTNNVNADCQFEIKTNESRIGPSSNTPLVFKTANTERVRITNVGRLGLDSTAPISKLQVGSHTFNGGNGMHTNDRVGMSNHGNLTGLMLASTYNDGTHPEYGLVFVQGPNTSSYNVWGLCPDGPAKGNSLNFHYAPQASNIHAPGYKKFEMTGEGYLLKPSHPSFRVGRNTDYNHTALQPVQFNTTTGTAHLNQGNHYNTSTHRFVAPVGGVYQFSACVIVNGIANNTDMTDLFYLYKNGTNMAYSMRRSRYVANTTGTSGYYVDFMSNVNLLMAANDYCDIRVRLSLSVHGNSVYTWFSGTLVG